MRSLVAEMPQVDSAAKEASTAAWRSRFATGEELPARVADL